MPAKHTGASEVLRPQRLLRARRKCSRELCVSVSKRVLREDVREKAIANSKLDFDVIFNGKFHLQEDVFIRPESKYLSHLSGPKVGGPCELAAC